MNAMAVGTPEETSNSVAPAPLEQFVLLAGGACGAAAAQLIEQVLESPGIHVFGELLEHPNIKELENGPHSKHFKTLNLFAYGTYKDYLNNISEFIELTPVQKKKLQHLTIVTLATQEKCIPYSLLLQQLEIKNVRDLEDLIIEAIYADIIHGKLDQEGARLEVDMALGRDARIEDAVGIASVLASWCQACESVLAGVDEHIARADANKQRAVQQKQQLELEVNLLIQNAKKQLKSQAEEELNGTGGGGSEHTMPIKKISMKGKTPRNTAKFWQKTT